MKFARLLEIVGNEPVFETELLLAGEANPRAIRRQLSLWTKAGRLYQLRRGLYALATPYQKVKPHPFLVANRMVAPSYVSRQSALAYYDLIPEYVPATTSVTTARPAAWETPLGRFDFRHIKASLLHGYRLIEVVPGQRALVATPAKALFDLLYLQAGADSPGYLRELRLQNLEQVDLNELRRLAKTAGEARLRRAADWVVEMARKEAVEYQTRQKQIC